MLTFEDAKPLLIDKYVYFTLFDNINVFECPTSLFLVKITFNSNDAVMFF